MVISHLHLIYQFLIVGAGSTAMAMTLQRARISGRPDHRSFALFWGIFTAWLAIKLVKNYLFLNADSLQPTGGLLLNALATDFGFLMVAAVIHYVHVLNMVRGQRIRDVVILICVLLSVILLSPPWGLRFDPESWVIEFRFGYWMGTGFYLAGLTYAATYSWIAVVRRSRGEDRPFLVALAVFATGGAIESLLGFAATVVDPVYRMGPQGFMYSGLPYLTYSVYLILHRGVITSIGTTRSVDSDMPINEAAERWGLSNREREVAALVIAGLGNKEIAERLFISTATVKTHVYRIFRKAGVDHRFGLIRVLQDD